MNDKNRNVIRYGLLTTSHGTCFHFTRTDRNVQYWPAKVSYLIIYNTQTICPQCHCYHGAERTDLKCGVCCIVYLRQPYIRGVDTVDARACLALLCTLFATLTLKTVSPFLCIICYIVAFICEVCCFKGNT